MLNLFGFLAQVVVALFTTPYLRGGADENQDQSASRTAGAPVEIRTEHLPNTSPDILHYVTLFPSSFH
jgi:hypothetical protein